MSEMRVNLNNAGSHYQTTTVQRSESYATNSIMNTSVVGNINTETAPVIEPEASDATNTSGTQQSQFLALTQRAADTKIESKYSKLIENNAQKYGVDSNVCKAVAYKETKFNLVMKGRRGCLTQMSPDSAKSVGVKNVKNPEQDIQGEVKFLSVLVKRYNGDYSKAVSAYHCGTGSVARGTCSEQYSDDVEHLAGGYPE